MKVTTPSTPGAGARLPQPWSVWCHLPGAGAAAPPHSPAGSARHLHPLLRLGRRAPGEALLWTALARIENPSKVQSN